MLLPQEQLTHCNAARYITSHLNVISPTNIEETTCAAADAVSN
jgi:hypothetical protein